MIPTFFRCLLVLASIWALQTRPVPTLFAGHGKPLRRTFLAGEESRYRVRLLVRREQEGPETAKTGAATRLHVVQEISGRVLANPASALRSQDKDEDQWETDPPTSSKMESFRAESLSTIALDDGQVIAASRSARKETVQVLPVEGMAQPQHSRATLSVQVEIEPCVGGKCEAGGNR